MVLGRNMEQNVPSLAVTYVATLDSMGGDKYSSPLPPLTTEQLRVEMDLPVIILHTSGSTGL